jgi:hypothetical protein
MINFVIALTATAFIGILILLWEALEEWYANQKD